jgi:hypothetical protein
MDRKHSNKKQKAQNHRPEALPATKKRKAKIVIDPVSGFPAATLGPGAPVLTSKEVEEILADFP